ncbi:MAG: TlpA family protein disulfide reductase [Phycisphaerales bacterium]|nr:TlpA family protein disulfide reductase [Phycisphaerales bacterium]
MTFILTLALSSLLALSVATWSQEAVVPNAAVDLAQADDPAAGDRPRLIQVGDMAPDFAVSTLNGQPVTLSDLRGKVVVLSFWFRPCDACVYDLQSTQAFSDWLDSQEDVPIVSLVMDEYSSWVNQADRDGEVPVDRRASTRAYLARKDITMDVLVDPRGLPVRTAYGVTAYPTRVIIDPDGRVVSVSTGSRGQRLLDILKSESLAAWHTWQARELQK